MNIQQYLDQVRETYGTGHATEHSYRAALQGLFQSIDPGIQVVRTTGTEGDYHRYRLLRIFGLRRTERCSKRHARNRKGRDGRFEGSL